MSSDDRRERWLQPEIIDNQRIGLPTGPQSDPAIVQDALIIAQGRANVLAPQTTIDFIPVDHVIQLMVVRFSIEGLKRRSPRPTRRDSGGEHPNPDYILADRNESNGLWYSVDTGKVAHSRVALDQLSMACGVSWIFDKCKRTDDRKHPYLWSYRMTCEYKGLDGRMHEVTRERELDLRGKGDNLSPEAKKAKGGLSRARMSGAQVCESKAANRAIRAALGLQSYTLDEAELPFVFPVLRWVPDMSNPLIAAMVAAKELGLGAELFGSGAFMDRLERQGQADQQQRQARVIDAEPAPAPRSRQIEAPNDMPDAQRAREREPVRVERDDDDGDPWNPPPEGSRSYQRDTRYGDDDGRGRGRR